MSRFRWTILTAMIAGMLLGAFSPTNLAANADSNVVTIQQNPAIGSLVTDSNSDANQMALHADRVGQTQISIAMDNGQTTAQQMAANTNAGNGAGKQFASTKGFNGHNWATTVWRNDERHLSASLGNSSGLQQHLWAFLGTTLNGTRQQYAMGIATTFNPPGCQYMAATNETWTDGHLAWRDDANMGGAAMAATGHHRLRALRQYLLGYEIAMMWQPATRQQLQL